MTPRAGALFLLLFLLTAAPAFAFDSPETLAAYARAEQLFKSGTHYPEAKAEYLKAANAGHGLSELRLGFLNAEAHFKGLTPDYAEAEKWFTKAAEQNAGDAQFRLGNFYANYKEPRDYPKAALWLRKAAEGGHRTAMFDLSRLLQEGKGVPRDTSEALSWMRRAAEADVLQAQMAMGELAPAEALTWTLRIANAPGASVFWLNKAGDALFDGPQRNYPAARRYYTRAAAKGDAHARERLEKIAEYLIKN